MAPPISSTIDLLSSQCTAVAWKRQEENSENLRPLSAFAVVHFSRLTGWGRIRAFDENGQGWQRSHHKNSENRGPVPALRNTLRRTKEAVLASDLPIGHGFREFGPRPVGSNREAYSCDTTGNSENCCPIPAELSESQIGTSLARCPQTMPSTPTLKCYSNCYSSTRVLGAFRGG
jgi:hypothetical protein